VTEERRIDQRIACTSAFSSVSAREGVIDVSPCSGWLKRLRHLEEIEVASITGSHPYGFFTAFSSMFGANPYIILHENPVENCPAWRLWYWQFRFASEII
jgi:hypothetical protein